MSPSESGNLKQLWTAIRTLDASLQAKFAGYDAKIAQMNRDHQSQVTTMSQTIRDLQRTRTNPFAGMNPDEYNNYHQEANRRGLSMMEMYGMQERGERLPDPLTPEPYERPTFDPETFDPDKA